MNDIHTHKKEIQIQNTSFIGCFLFLFLKSIAKPSVKSNGGQVVEAPLVRVCVSSTSVSLTGSEEGYSTVLLLLPLL